MILSIFLKMLQSQLLHVVGSNDEKSGRYETQYDGIRLKENSEMAITTLFHYTIYNVTSENNIVPIQIVTWNESDSIPTNITLVHGDGNKEIIATDESIEFIPRNEKFVDEELKIEPGNYPSTLNLLKVIATEIEDAYQSEKKSASRRRKPRMVKPIKIPRLIIDESFLNDDKEGFIYITVENLRFNVGENTPWSLISPKVTNLLQDGQTYRFQNINYSKSVFPAFLYSNIIENSYINGKLSRNLSVIPLSMKTGWNHYEFKVPIFVPIDVEQFSKTVFEIRGMDGKLIQFDPTAKTLLKLYIKPINRDANGNY